MIQLVCRGGGYEKGSAHFLNGGIMHNAARRSRQLIRSSQFHSYLWSWALHSSSFLSQFGAKQRRLSPRQISLWRIYLGWFRDIVYSLMQIAARGKYICKTISWNGQAQLKRRLWRCSGKLWYHFAVEVTYNAINDISKELDNSYNNSYMSNYPWRWGWLL